MYISKCNKIYSDNSIIWTFGMELLTFFLFYISAISIKLHDVNNLLL